MTLSIAYLGPQGTYSEQAALTYREWLYRQGHRPIVLESLPTILQTIQAVSTAQVDLAIVPVENSIEGSVSTTLDALWELDSLQIQEALILSIDHALLTYAQTLAAIKTVYSHPQALGQCQQWIQEHCPDASLEPTRSTTEALQFLATDPSSAAIASQRAAQLYGLPTLAPMINDQPDNCTKFWILGTQVLKAGTYTSLAFSLPVNAPGALLQPLQILSQESINLSRIESRPTKRSLGEYLFFLDLEASIDTIQTQTALKMLADCTETLKILGCYDVIPNQAKYLMHP